MQSLSKILLPVDFSERSAGAAHYARLLATHFDSEVILLHVLPPEGSPVLGELDGYLSEELAGLKVRRVTLEGDPTARIIEFANGIQEGQGASLIIMPTHSYGPFRRFVMGSHTAKVLHEVHCPVWTGVHIEQAPDHGSIPIRKILCAIDLGPESSRTLCWAAQLAMEFGARLFAVHATGPAPEPESTSEANWQSGIRQAAEAELQRLGQFVNADAELIVEGGDPEKVICATAERSQADLLVIGRGSAAGVYGHLRTNAHAIIRMSPCPVVSV